MSPPSTVSNIFVSSLCRSRGAPPRAPEPVADRRPGMLARSAGPAAVLISAAFPLACQAFSSLTVTFAHDEQASVEVRVRIPTGLEPDMSWSGTGHTAPYRLALAWHGNGESLIGPLPTVPPVGIGPVQTVALRSTPEQARLELQINQPIQPSLRRVGDSWVLTLTPVPLRSNLAIPQEVPNPSTATVSMQPAHVQRPSQTKLPHAVGGPSPPTEMLLLDMTVNGQRQAMVARAEQSSDGALLISEDAWTEARLAPTLEQRTLTDGTPAFSLGSLPEARYRIDRSKLSLEIDAPASAFIVSKLEAPEPGSKAPPRPEPGIMVNYELSLAHSGSDNALTSGATVEGVAFNRFGSFVSSGLVSDDGTRRTMTRLDSYWRYDMPERMESLSVGDTVGSGGGWSRPARFAGVRWARNFGLRPGFVTLPQVSVSGQAALPSTVDVLVNNVQRLSQRIQPGPFDVTNVPVVTGAGELNLVVRDLLGRETVVKQSYYASPHLLAAGLTDFSMEAGWLRAGYGQDSRYGDAFAAGTLRSGWLPNVTGELRLEMQGSRRAGGMELAGLLGNWATARAAVAASTDSLQGIKEQGHLLQLGVERYTPLGGASLQYEYAARGFAPFGEAALPGAAGQRAREQWLAAVAGKFSDQMTGGLNYVRQTRWDGERVASLGLSVGAPLGPNASLNLALNKRLDERRDWTAMVNVNVSLEDGVHTSSRVERQGNGELLAAAAVSRSAPAGSGVGWRAEASTQAAQRARGAVQYNGDHAEWTLDLASNAKGQVAARTSGRGTVGMVAGFPFATRPVGEGSVAVVQVEGLEGVPVKRSHQVVAHTDDRGYAFVPGLVPWYKNQIEIDPADLPMDVDLRETVQEVVPYARSGNVVRFGAHRSRQALVIIHQANGKPVPPGAQVRLLPEGSEFLTGRRGEVWLTDLPVGSQQVRVRWPGGACELELALPKGDRVPDRIGPLTCGNGR